MANKENFIEKYIVEYFYEGENRLRCFTDFHRLHIFIDRCLLEDVPIIRLYRKEFWKYGYDKE